MSTQYIINNSDGLLTGQTITGNITVNGDLSVTGTTNILPYKVYTALLTQSGTDDPIATVLENTIGADVTLSRMFEGYYKIDFVNTPNTERIFLYNGSTFTGNQIYVPISDGGSLVGYYNISPDSFSSTLAVVLNTQDSTFTSSEWSNIIGISKIPIEIRVYN